MRDKMWGWPKFLKIGRDAMFHMTSWYKQSCLWHVLFTTVSHHVSIYERKPKRNQYSLTFFLNQDE